MAGTAPFPTHRPATHDDAEPHSTAEAHMRGSGTQKAEDSERSETSETESEGEKKSSAGRRRGPQRPLAHPTNLLFTVPSPRNEPTIGAIPWRDGRGPDPPRPRAGHELSHRQRRAPSGGRRVVRRAARRNHRARRRERLRQERDGA